ncbi:hypothetical protein E2C01_029479 [Portunus trituberculatus]|uniref:Uncharacterized protein n=1 Tax=Portunus trituberculatus TaxID=210409 RepID=A0A5B7ERK2_PORTR|nr:hypothetical protein [Portunus trituberculatus]
MQKEEELEVEAMMDVKKQGEEGQEEEEGKEKTMSLHRRVASSQSASHAALKRSQHNFSRCTSDQFTTTPLLVTSAVTSSHKCLGLRCECICGTNKQGGLPLSRSITAHSHNRYPAPTRYPQRPPHQSRVTLQWSSQQASLYHTSRLAIDTTAIHNRQRELSSSIAAVMVIEQTGQGGRGRERRPSNSGQGGYGEEVRVGGGSNATPLTLSSLSLFTRQLGIQQRIKSLSTGSETAK